MQQDSILKRWGEKPYYSLDYYFKQKFGEKVYKIALDAGMTCPNRDGTLGTRGCIFCSNGGSGEFATGQSVSGEYISVTEQINKGIERLKMGSKYTGRKYIAYFQSFSNTYAPVEHLRSLYREALVHPDVVGLSIATRPDCFTEEIYDLLAECNATKPVWVELGLQTMHEETAAYIRRGYALPAFEEAVRELHKRNLEVVVHIILGLPGEGEKEVLETIRYLNTLKIQGIKLQLLHVLQGTDLAKELENLHVLSEEEYVNLVLQCVCALSPDIVIHRLTGDGPKDLLIAPRWSRNKRAVLNRLMHEMKVRQIYQGSWAEYG